MSCLDVGVDKFTGTCHPTERKCRIRFYHDVYQSQSLFATAHTWASTIFLATLKGQG